MKKILVLLMTLIISLTSFAQIEHIKFMGIPIDGSLKSFCSKLKKKGFVRDPYDTRDKDKRIFIGNFAGSKSKIFIYSDKKTKTVHSVVVTITTYTEDIAISEYKNFKKLLIEKYSEDIGVITYKKINDKLAEEINRGEEEELKWIYEYMTKEGYESTTLVLPRPTHENPLNNLGIISIYPSKFYSYAEKRIVYDVTISYSDTQNYSLYKNNIQNDL